MRLMRIRRGEEGSIAVTVSVAFIATGLCTALLTTVWRDLRVTRRSGDSANALQVGDAGLNEAIKGLKDASGAVNTCKAWPSLPGFTRTSTIAGGTYTYCAARDADAQGRPVWHVDAVGIDATGVKRRLRSEAISAPLFPNAINVIASGAFSSGFSVDSYKDEVNRCTKKGIVGTNSPDQFEFGNNGNNSSENCQNNPNGTWPYPPDGCVAYSDDGTAAIPADQVQTGQCPPSNTTKALPKFEPFHPGKDGSSIVYDVPAPGTGPGGTLTCNASTKLTAGKAYYFTNVKLEENCGFPSAGPFPTMANPTIIYTTTLTIAGGTGNGGGNNNAGSQHPINPPPNNASVCGPTHGMVGSNPMYCPGWPGGLRIYVLGGGESVKFTGNHSTFWGVISAPNASVNWVGGSSQWEIFGSMVANSVSGAVQAKWHYDENLGSLTSGAFHGTNWREEPLGEILCPTPGGSGC
jgi:hypothetical protein